MHLVVSSHPSRPLRIVSSELVTRLNKTHCGKYCNARRNFARVSSKEEKKNLLNTMKQNPLFAKKKKIINLEINND